MKRSDFARNTNLSEAWRKVGVPTANISQATRWHDAAAGVWTLWLENPNGVNFESFDKGAKLVLTPWANDGRPRTPIHEAKSLRYWRDLREAAVNGRVIRILAVKWRRHANGTFVEEQHGATVPVYWREMRASMHEDDHRIVLTEPAGAA